MKSKDVKIEYKYREFYEFFRREISRTETVGNSAPKTDEYLYEKIFDENLVDEIYSRFIREKIVKKAEENQRKKDRREAEAEKRRISAFKAESRGASPAKGKQRGIWADWIDKNEKDSAALLLKLSEEKNSDFTAYIQTAFSAAQKRKARR